ncbi:MAG: hypothetical protein M1827_005326 [Pycnora praestabilis]|nr:MAG: hypothetical protein M1827_005326 [Pycnora praestabilis]
MSLPKITVEDDVTAYGREWDDQPSTTTHATSNGVMENLPTRAPFLGITTDIPTGNLEDLTSPGRMEFSKRGSILIGGTKANIGLNGVTPPGRLNGGRRQPSVSMIVESTTASRRVLSFDEEQLSQKVRSMYEFGDESATYLNSPLSFTSRTGNMDESVISEDEASDNVSNSGRDPEASKLRRPSTKISRKTSTVKSRRDSIIKREEHEIAGGIEDWQNVDGRDVDRYGFIIFRKNASRASSITSENRDNTPERPRPQRASTVLQLASEMPRRKRTLRRSPSNTRTARSAAPRTPSRKASGRSLKPPGSTSSCEGGRSIGQLPHSAFRHAANRLPYNRDRRWMDEAGDMLTLPPGLADIAELEEGGKAAADLKRKEWRREEKWRKMARVVTRGRDGGGMVFEFDTKDPKLISRTWKGIPDRWRATAWHAFLSTSAKRKGSRTDGALLVDFYRLLEESSADDVQIDIDVPRTINSHIMFRRRYRGGQRLLFRVLHALSLYFPETGYVQGMACLAATLLCYYDEDTTFIMLVRMWQLRGLERLYQSGFEGLMEALDELEKTWLGGGEVAQKLEGLGIGPTAYGTRWYLTLFNYSIPFPAQLRVWDVFMLLGDAGSRFGQAGFDGGLDVLHATSAALIDGTREILLDSDFENAMKVLTSWIPIKDEELLMKVAKAEWKQRRKGA